MTDQHPTDETEAQPQTVQDLLARINRERGPLERLAAEMSDDTLVTNAGSSDDWSPRDHLTHVAEWERRLLGEIRGDHAAANFGLDEAAQDDATTAPPSPTTSE